MRALALACAGRIEESERAVERSRSISSAAEPQDLAKLATAITAIVRQSSDAQEIVSTAFEGIERSGNVDAFVTAYRGCPELLAAVASDSGRHAGLRAILTRANDLQLGRRVLPAPLAVDVSMEDAAPLSPREQEVITLVSQGLRNKEIAQKLFITEVTVKAHMRNIMRKLGARSRTHAVSLARSRLG
jgi:LuxR family maltose regulon positive regulatory protein